MVASKSAPRKKSVMRFSGKIFISYRRGDSASTTGRIYDWLASRHSKKDIFFDIESLEYGTDFEQRIQQSIPQSKVVLAIIGPHWLDDGVGPSKWVRAELELALSKGIPIIPVKVDGSTMPSPQQLPASLQALSTLNAAEVRPGKDFQHDMELLAKPLGIPLLPRAQRILRSPGFWMLTGSAVALVALSTVGLLGGFPGTSTATDPRASETATAGVISATQGARQTYAAATQTAGESAAIASQTAAAVTATANALAPYTYRTNEPGPRCDPMGRWTAYAILTPGGGFSCLANGGGVQITGPDALNFSGADGFTFPVRSAISVDMQIIHPLCGAFVDVTMGGGGVTGDFRIDTCDGPTGWAVSAAIKYGMPYSKRVVVADADVYHITIIVNAGSSIQFFVNSQLLDTINTSSNALLVFGPAAASVSMGVENLWLGRGPAMGKAVFSQFVVVPQQ